MLQRMSPVVAHHCIRRDAPFPVAPGVTADIAPPNSHTPADRGAACQLARIDSENVAGEPTARLGSYPAPERQNESTSLSGGAAMPVILIQGLGDL
jgi:hypothetical protein